MEAITSKLQNISKAVQLYIHKKRKKKKALRARKKERKKSFKSKTEKKKDWFFALKQFHVYKILPMD